MNTYNEFLYRMHKHGKDTGLVVLMPMGDFYETYDESAGRCAAVLHLKLNEQVKPDKTKHFITGFPKHALEGYVHDLVAVGCRVVVLDKECNETIYTKENINQTIKNNKTMATMKKNFRTVNGSTKYMFNSELQALVEVTPLREVFNLDSGVSMQEWRVVGTDKTMKTHYTPATEEEPEQFDGKMYKTLKDFEAGNAIPMEDIFYGYDNEVRIVQCLVPAHGRSVSFDAEGAYIWTMEKGEAVKWYFRKHITNVTWEYNEKGQITVTSDCEIDIPESYRSSEDVYKYNDYRFIDGDGKEQIREGVYKRLFLEPDQKALAEKLQAVLDECKKAKMLIYWSNADYTLNAVNLRKVQRVEYDPEVTDDEEAYYFDDSRCSHVFKNVTDYNSEDSDVKFVIKKQ
jgi:hypothetical protein